MALYAVKIYNITMTNDRVAIVSLVDPVADHARMLHAFEYVFDLKNNGIHAELFLDGASVKVIDFLQKNPNDIIKALYYRAIREGVVKEACNFCANAFGVKAKVLSSNIQLSPENQHISIGRLMKDDYQIITL